MREGVKCHETAPENISENVRIGADIGADEAENDTRRRVDRGAWRSDVMCVERATTTVALLPLRRDRASVLADPAVLVFLGPEWARPSVGFDPLPVLDPAPCDGDALPVGAV